MKNMILTICILFGLSGISIAEDKFIITKEYKPGETVVPVLDPITNSFVITTEFVPVKESPKDGCICKGEEGFTKSCNSNCDCRGKNCDCENCTCFKESDIVPKVQTTQPARQPQQYYQPKTYYSSPCGPNGCPTVYQYKQPTVYYKIPAATYSGGCASGGCSTSSGPLRRLFGR